MRRTKYRIPTNAAQTCAPDPACTPRLRCDVTVQTKSRSTDREHQCKHKYGALGFADLVCANQRSGLNLFSGLKYLTTMSQGALVQGAYSKWDLHKNKCFFLKVPVGRPKAAPGRYPWLLHSRYRRARGNRLR